VDHKHGHLCADSLDDLEALIVKVKRKFKVEVICLSGDLQCTLLEDGEFIGPRTTPSRHSNGSVRQLLVSEFCVKWKLRAVNTWPAGTHYNNRWKARTQIDYILVTDSAGGSGGVVVHWPLLRLNEDHRPVAAKGFKSQIETEKQPLQYSMKGWKPCTDEADEEYKQGVLHSVGVAESVDMTGVHEAIGEVASQIDYTTTSLETHKARMDTDELAALRRRLLEAVDVERRPVINDMHTPTGKWQMPLERDSKFMRVIERASRSSTRMRTTWRR